MWENFQNIFKIPEVRRRILFTLAMFLVFRFGCFIPVPGVNINALAQSTIFQTGAFGLMNIFAGGALRRLSIFALGIMPYISASIIMQLLTVAIPRLEELARQGEEGRRKITQYARYATVPIAVIQGLGLTAWIQNVNNGAFVVTRGIGFLLPAVITLVTGTVFLMWLGEKITEKGIGNGISLIIFAGIVAQIRPATGNILKIMRTGQITPFSLFLFVILAILITAAVVVIYQGERRIPIRYARRVMGRRAYGGQTSYLPIRIGGVGVIAIIFAVSLLLLPSTVARFIPHPFAQQVAGWLSTDNMIYYILYALAVIFFTFFYTAVVFNPVEIADNIRKYGGFVPGLRPGRPTAEYITAVLTRVTFVAALFFAFIAILPPIINRKLLFNSFPFGGTSILIAVGVALDTAQQLQSHLLMRHYKGFMK
ncbi:preprotein translocase subunit SecY [Candidatus Aerophobetes bacterium]|uniref:Protein translocase subunit SecY n=1 Tax=Aerophobetes bacterium TaxID=2030807 RepID=A0A497E5K4_UNCAE|nr:preprotein translocase subunit SecY [Candidatus Aerophobetes bacterium]RLE10508.1 MAG: preprotein translocase subunit SecY [Candidatus Aerophobetes bacterium]